MRLLHDEWGEREDLAHGEIDLAADQQHDLAAGDDRRRGDELRERLEIGVGEKIDVGELEIDDEGDGDDDDARLGAQQEIAQAPGDAAARGRRPGRARQGPIAPSCGTICAVASLPS
jgi:hypothetical protein